MKAGGCLALVAAAFALCAAAFAQPLPGAPAGSPAASTAPAKVGVAPGAKDAPPAQPTRAEDKDVIEASQKWLKLIDGGHYGDAWDGGAAPLKSAVTRKGFVAGIGEARKPYGKVAARKPGRFARAHDLPGGPQGDYALVSFETRFANGKTAEEQVIWLLEADRSGDNWRVSGYFIR